VLFSGSYCSLELQRSLRSYTFIIIFSFFIHCLHSLGKLQAGVCAVPSIATGYVVFICTSALEELQRTSHKKKTEHFRNTLYTVNLSSSKLAAIQQHKVVCYCKDSGMIFCWLFEQCCPFYRVITSVTISGWLIHLFIFKPNSQNMLSLVLGRTDISFS